MTNEPVTIEDIQALQDAYNNIVKKLKRGERIEVTLRTACTNFEITYSNPMYWATLIHVNQRKFDVRTPDDLKL